MMHADPTTVLLTGSALFIGHHIGDYWLQSDHQALTKGACGREGLRACAAHVASLTLAQLVALALFAVVTGIGLEPVAALLGLGVNALTHLWADRRRTLRGLVLATERWTAKLNFFDHGGGSAPMDQAWHFAWCGAAALIAGSPTPLAVALTAAAAVALAACDIASRRARLAEQRPQEGVASAA